MSSGATHEDVVAYDCSIADLPEFTINTSGDYDSTDRQVDTATALAAVTLGRDVVPFGVDLMTPASVKPGDINGEKNSPHTTCLVQGHGKNVWRLTDDD